MNWLAHLYLSTAQPEFQLGNLLADQVRGADRTKMSSAFQKGAACHLAIDVFTERHPITQRSRQRIPSSHRRFSGILVDIYYDHCLARDWSRYSPQPLAEFTQTAYQALLPLAPGLPEEARITLERIIEYDWLTSYQTLDGIADILQRLSHRLAERWQRDVDLMEALPELTAQDAALSADFHEFFPQLQAHVGPNQI